MRKVLTGSAIVALGTMLLGATNAPLSLADVLERANQLTTTQAAVALRDAVDAAAAARSRPRASITTSLVSQPQSGTSPQYQGAVEYTLEFGSSLRRLGALQAAQAQVVASSATLTQVRRGTAQAVVAAFFELATAQADFATQGENVALAKRTLAVVTIRRSQGVSPDLDVSRANAVYAVAEANLAAVQAEMEGAHDILLGFVAAAQPFDTVVLPETSTSLPETSAVVAAAVMTNPEVGNALANLRSAQVGATLARAELSPALSIGAGPGISRTGAAQSVGPAATISYDVPISNALLRSDIGAAMAAVLVAEAGVERARRDAIRTALSARTAAASSMARLPLLRSAVAATQRVADADLAGYKLGAVPVTELLTAQTQASAARGALTTATVAAAEARASLQLEMGDFVR